MARGFHLQSAGEEQTDQTQSLVHRFLEPQERNYRYKKDDEVRQEISRGDDVACGVLVDAVAVWDRLVPEVGKGTA